jgi:predicted small lipoprotein YifL
MRLATVTQASVLAVGMALMLAACGQKGALYLPDKNAAIVTPPPAAPAQSAAPQPQAAPSQPPQATPATPKKTDKDGESRPPQ